MLLKADEVKLEARETLEPKRDPLTLLREVFNGSTDLSKRDLSKLDLNAKAGKFNITKFSYKQRL